ncbi:MAG: Re/Si-specific NAD(P)(+) transhydrogenase subunit alpha [Planctomycetales bacterium]|nr:Re/Si-specific NAD(P)(+) transhydrogenase subunit alpha [Planctomycetales bacterium]
MRNEDTQFDPEIKMKIGVVKETFPGERRVALTPASLPPLQKQGCEILVEHDAGTSAGYTDAAYVAQGASVVERLEVFQADVVVGVRWAGANAAQQAADTTMLRSGQMLVGNCDPLGQPEAIAQLAGSGVDLFGLEMIPRITRAQSMDVLSSQATIAGYRAVLLAATELPRMFPLMMTAAGTLSPARVFVIGAGVAGLQAIATSRRLGAVVQAYDVRPAVREQCESLGAKFVELPLETSSAEGQGGYAKAMDEDFYRRQRELMAKVVSESDVVITTAAIPGKPSPRLITADAVAGMQPGSVIVDLAAERGGNCELSQADQRVIEHGVTILGPTNLPAEVPYHASQMFAKNVATFLLHLIKQGQVELNLEDEITRETLLTHNGQVSNARLRSLLGIETEAKSE